MKLNPKSHEALRRLAERPLSVTFLGGRGWIHGRVARALVDRGVAVYRTEPIPIGGGFSVGGLGVEITDRGRSWLKANP